MLASKKERKEAAFQAKLRGSEHFRDGHLLQALECYDRAISLDVEEPVYFANRCACLFELSRYEESLEDSKHAAELYKAKARTGFMSGADLDVVLVDLFRRAARGMLCINTPDCISNAAKLLNVACNLKEGDAELEGMKAWAHKQAAAAAAAGALSAMSNLSLTRTRSADEPPTPPPSMVKQTSTVLRALHERPHPTLHIPRYRPSLSTGHREYFAVGHEPAWSALASPMVTPADMETPLMALDTGDEDDEDGERITIDKRNDDDEPITILFGGTNDARQLLATFRDIQQQVEAANGALGYARGKLSVVCNDIRPHCFARLMVIFRALEELSIAVEAAAKEDEPDWTEARGVRVPDLLHSSVEVARAAFLVYHLYLGAFLLPHERDWLKTALDDVIEEMCSGAVGGEGEADKGTTVGEGTTNRRKRRRPWAQRDPGIEEKVRVVAREWRAMLDDPQGSELMATCYEWAVRRPEDEGLDGELEAAEDVDRSGRFETLSEQRKAMRDEIRKAMLRRIEEMEDDELDMLKTLRPPEEFAALSPTEQREELKRYWAREVDPRTLDAMACMPNAHRELEFFYNTMVLPVPPTVVPDGDGRDLMDLSKARDLHRQWAPNVTVLAKDWLDFTGGKADLQFCPFHNIKLLLSGPADAEILASSPAFESASTFFIEAAIGLSGLVKAHAIQVRVNVGDVHELKGLPHSSFDRVYVSNIPDYTTLLPTMVFLGELLKNDGSARLKHNVLRFTSLYRDINEYVHSMTYVPDLVSVPVYLGLSHEHGGIWAHFVEWGRARQLEPESQHVLSFLDARIWLLTIFFSIATPVLRDAELVANEPRPLSLNFFFELCYFVLKRQHVAPHVIAIVLEAVMRGQVETMAIPPDQSPWPQTQSWRLRQVSHSPKVQHTGAFSLELRTLAGLWAPRFGFQICPPVGHTLPKPEEVVQVSMRMTIPAESLDMYGQQLAPVLGVAVLSPQFVNDHSGMLHPRPCTSANPLASVIQALLQGGQPEGPTPDSLRSTLLSPATQSSGHVHLLSCVRWESDSSTVHVFLPAYELRALREKGFKAVLLRTDSWTAVSNTTDLSTATVSTEATPGDDDDDLAM